MRFMLLMLVVSGCVQSASIIIVRAAQEIGRSKLEGAVAQLGERLICIQEVAGSIPTSSTSFAAPNVLIGPIAQLARAHP